jgi:hypothetical protein
MSGWHPLGFERDRMLYPHSWKQILDHPPFRLLVEVEPSFKGTQPVADVSFLPGMMQM